MRQHWSKMLTVLLFTFFLLGPCLSVQAAYPPDVQKAARAGLNDFCEFDTPVHLGFGFQVHTVNPYRLTGETGAVLEAMAFPTDIWRFLVMTGEEPAGLLTVAKVNGEWQAVSFGGAELAAEINEIAKAWPGKNGFHFRFIRIYQAKSDFMEIRSSRDTLGFAPLKSAKIALSLNSFKMTPNTLLHNSEILEPLREIVSRVISRYSDDSAIYQREK